MENKKVTAVDWFVQQLEEYGSDDFKIIFKKQFEQAKAMEKEQMISAMIYTFNQQNTLPYGMEYLLNRDGMLEDCENYYKETYGE
jgi:hypothetical protein